MIEHTLVNDRMAQPLELGSPEPELTPEAIDARFLEIVDEIKLLDIPDETVMEQEFMKGPDKEGGSNDEGSKKLKS